MGVRVQGHTWGTGAGEEGTGVNLGVQDDTYEYKGET